MAWIRTGFWGVILLLAMVRLESVPPLWWDEGWTLSIARNWFETGQYKRLLDARLSPGGLEAAPAVTGSIYLAFRVLGVGIIQARVVGVLYTVGGLLVVYYLARRLYNLNVAVAVLAVLTVLPAYIELIPMYLGRQVLGEMPALFFLLIGYAWFMISLTRKFVWLLIPVLFWSIALNTKAQVLPFWLCSIVVPLFIAVYRQDWQLVGRFTVSCIGSIAGCQLLFVLWRHLLWADGMGSAVTGLYEVTAIVSSLPARLFSLIIALLFGIPTFVGLCHGTWSMFAKRSSFDSTVEYIRLSLLILAGSWFAWFVLFSVGWIRYIFPATFIGSIFVAAMIYEFTRGFDVSYTIQKSMTVFKGVNRQGIAALFVVALLVTSVPRSAMALYDAYISDADTSVQEAAEFLNSHTGADVLIETYDSELFFLLNRRYHYPSDQIHVQLIRRTFLYEDNTHIDYNPLAADPDYLVIGPHSKQWRLYDDVLKAGAFRLVRSYRRYEIYERVR